MQETKTPQGLSLLTALVYVVDGAGRVFNREGIRLIVLARSAAAFRHYDELVARDLVLLDGFADDLLAYTIGVYVGGIPLVERRLSDLGGTCSRNSREVLPNSNPCHMPLSIAEELLLR